MFFFITNLSLFSLLVLLPLVISINNIYRESRTLNELRITVITFRQKLLFVIIYYLLFILPPIFDFLTIVIRNADEKSLMKPILKGSRFWNLG